MMVRDSLSLLTEGIAAASGRSAQRTVAPSTADMPAPDAAQSATQSTEPKPAHHPTAPNQGSMMAHLVPTSPSQPARLKPVVDTWDVFDTLIARRCVAPEGVFALVEAQLGRPGWAAARQQIGDLAWQRGGDYTLADLHQQLAADPRFAGTAELSMQLECAAEISQVVPIKANIRRLQAGDMLVSDMYLPAATIRAMLDVAGVSRGHPLIVTPRGKHDGWLFDRLLDHYRLRCHHGDNPVADRWQPARRNIATDLVTIAQPNEPEKMLQQLGLGWLAQWMRALRLANPFDPQQQRPQQQAWALQAAWNLPLLVLLALLLRDEATNRPGRRWLFVSRDGHFLHQYFRVLAPQIASDYLHVSRDVLVNGDPASVQALQSRLLQPAMLVDLCGSGASWDYFAAKFPLPEPPGLFLLLYLDGYRSAVHDQPDWDGRGVLAKIAVLARSKIGGNSSHLERLNQPDQRRCAGLVMPDPRIGVLPLPSDDDIDHDNQTAAAAEDFHREAIPAFAAWVGAGNLPSIDADTRIKALTWLTQRICTEPAIGALQANHDAQERSFMLGLAQAAAQKKSATKFDNNAAPKAAPGPVAEPQAKTTAMPHTAMQEA